MEKNSKTYNLLIDRFTLWAEQEENVRAALIIGSRARADHPAHEQSYLNSVVLAHDPAPYWQTTEWLTAVGIPWLHFVEPTPDGRSAEHRVLFASSLDVDFALSPTAVFRQMLETGLPPDIADTLRRGSRLLLDKDNLARLLPDLSGERSRPHCPSEHDFLNSVHNFWYHTLWTAKHLRCGELWQAKSCCDMHLKVLLQQMLEWHARATQGQQTDTWLRGRFLEEWAAPRAVAALSKTFAHYDETDIWQRLLATRDLYAWLERETAVALNYTYPTDGAAKTAALVSKLFESRLPR